jgi:hypothetical protein
MGQRDQGTPHDLGTAHMLTRNGIVNQENMNLDGLAADGVYVFTYVYSPVPIAGATGSAGSPIAID